MMQSIMTQEITFYAWCILTDSMLYYAEADFMLNYWGSQNRKLIPHYVMLNTLITAVAIWTQAFLIFNILHIAVLFYFSVSVLHISAKCVVTPAVIIFTFSTFREGSVAVIMQYLSSTITSQAYGTFFQFALPAALGVIFFLTLRFIARRYPLMNKNLISSYLYIPLLPGALIIVGIRTGIGSDSCIGRFRHQALLSSDPATVMYTILYMVGTLLVFLIIIEMIHKITMLSGQEMERALLAGEIKEQRSYLDEARQRNEGYRSFQHDINNHLLVLSGLISSQKYKQAQRYLQKLNMVTSVLSEEISTGNSVLDILLWEKIRYAKQHQITVTCDVQIPKESTIDDIDLCILFANGLDNAINACIEADLKHRTVAVTARPKHTFLFIEVENEVKQMQPVVYGTGLRNVELTVRKYAGTMRTEQKHNRFYLSILLNCKKAAENDYCRRPNR